MVAEKIAAVEQEIELVEGIMNVLDQVALTLAEVEQVIAMLQPQNQYLYQQKLNHLKRWVQAHSIT